MPVQTEDSTSTLTRRNAKGSNRMGSTTCQIVGPLTRQGSSLFRYLVHSTFMLAFRKQNQILSHSNLFNLKTCKFKIQVPNNAAVQIYDYKSKHSRVVFGPDLVMLQPNEEFTQLSLSGGKPKRPNLIRSVALLLGPDYTSDIITVETSDHACLQLQLSYHWHFEVRYLLHKS